MTLRNALMAGLLAAVYLVATDPATAETARRVPENLVVTASRDYQSALNVAANIARIGADDLTVLAANHAYDLGVQVPGVWISRNSGQEQLTAIRSPVLTGAGSCGAFLILEDGIPTRPAGFCNVNQLFEVPTELATAVEIIRGPSNAYYGSNGLHGTINTLLPEPGRDDFASITIEGGSHSFGRSKLRWNSGPGRNAISAGLMLDHDGGYRDSSGYEQVKAFVKSRHEKSDGLLGVTLTLSALDQETAGFITGFEAYKDKTTRFTNPNPEAFRDAGSQRLAVSWEPRTDSDWQPLYRAYLRNSDMEFLQHFLPGQPLEENGQTSGGLMVSAGRGIAEAGRLTVGLDGEISRGLLKETQAAPALGSAFIQETRPAGKHYDYSVVSYQLAGYANLNWPLTDRWEFVSGLRLEYLRYRYDNKMLAGNTRDDGTACGFGGCQYNRPADRGDAFVNIAPNLGLLYRFSKNTVGFANLTRGFRAPQATELYRLQRSQNIADINPVTADSIEAGIRHQGGRVNIESVVYHMRKRHFIFRDASDFNVSNGKTSHTGIEINADWQISDTIYFALTGSYANQEYRFNSAADLGETIVKGNQVDTAPRALASTRLGWANDLGRAELEWAYTDGYFLDAANTARYGGHRLLNLRFLMQTGKNWTLGLRLNNLTDATYADRADLLSVQTPPEYRYFPGHPREFYASISWQN
jgi:outer membrane receptor protein involved in Fe transport